MSEAICEGSNKNRIFIAFAIEWNSGIGSRALLDQGFDTSVGMGKTGAEIRKYERALSWRALVKGPRRLSVQFNNEEAHLPATSSN